MKAKIARLMKRMATEWEAEAQPFQVLIEKSGILVTDLRSFADQRPAPGEARPAEGQRSFFIPVTNSGSLIFSLKKGGAGTGEGGWSVWCEQAGVERLVCGTADDSPETAQAIYRQLVSGVRSLRGGRSGGSRGRDWAVGAVACFALMVVVNAFWPQDAVAGTEFCPAAGSEEEEATPGPAVSLPSLLPAPKGDGSQSGEEFLRRLAQ